jgi:hypothetical protein
MTCVLFDFGENLTIPPGIALIFFVKKLLQYLRL